MNLDRILICGFLFVGGAIFFCLGSATWLDDFAVLFGLIAALLGGIPLVAYWKKIFWPIIENYVKESSKPDTETKEDNHEDR